MRAPARFFLFFLLSFTLLSASARAAGQECRRHPAETLKVLEAGKDPAARSRAGACLVRSLLDHQSVAKAVLRIIRDPGEDLLLREDLVEAFGEATLRRQVRLESELSPELGAQDQAALARTVASANGLLAVTRAVKSMQETVPVCPLEGELFRALSEIAMDDASHVLLREAAVEAMEKASKRVVESGLYDERQLRMVQETLRTVAARDDNASYFSGAALAYNRLADASVPGFPRPAGSSVNPPRMLSSMKGAPAK